MSPLTKPPRISRAGIAEPAPASARLHTTARLSRRLCQLLTLLLLGPTLPAQPSDPYAATQSTATQSAATQGTAAQNTSAPHPDDLLQHAKALIQLNTLADVTAADPLLRRYIAQHPASAEALFLLGYVLQRENKPRDSLTVYTQAASIAPPQSDDLRIVALDYVLLNDYVDAIHWLQRSLAANPGNAAAWYDLGRAQMNQGNFVDAERDFRKTLALSPGDPKAFDNLGLSLEAQNRTEEALSAYTQAMEAQRSKPHPTEQPLLNLGTLLNTKNRSAEAIAPLQQAIALTPLSPRCHEELARAYLATHQEATGTREMEQAVALDPRNPRLHYQLGQIYRHAGMSARAEAELKTSSELYGSRSTPIDK